MALQLSFLYHPVRDVGAAVAFYRDELGLDEAWRMGDDTAALPLPGTAIPVVLSVDAAPSAPASGFFQIDDVDEFHRTHADRITFVDEPQDLPPIRYASFRDPDGNLVRLWTDLEESQRRRADAAGG